MCQKDNGSILSKLGPMQSIQYTALAIQPTIGNISHNQLDMWPKEWISPWLQSSKLWGYMCLESMNQSINME